MNTDRADSTPSVPDHDPGQRRTAVVRLCARAWDGLAATADDGIRYCDRCSQKVFRALDEEGFAVAVAAGRCVWIPEKTPLPADAPAGPFLGGVHFIDEQGPSVLQWDD